MQNTPMQYTIVRSKHIDYVLVAQTDKGVCAIYLGDTPQIVKSELYRAFPKAQFHYDPSNVKLCATIMQIFDYLEHGKGKINILSDIQGTPFQKNVWRILQKIPVGQTMTYAAVAIQMGYPKSYRAVANACASNLLSIIIPCHRVIKKNGQLSDYRWGIQRKQFLLQQEKVID